MENKKYSKICSSCGLKQYYSNSSNLIRAIKLNTVCKKCNKMTEETKNLISIANKGKKRTQEQNKKMIAGLKKLWENKTPEEKKLWSKIVSKTSKDRWENIEYKKTMALSVKNSWHALSQEERYKRHEASLKGGAGYCKYMEFEGYEIFGNTEKNFLQYIKNKNEQLPIKGKRLGVNTPYGIYFPDFDFGDYYVEIKSEWTYKQYSEPNNKQKIKLEWTNNNIKPVKILVENKSGQFIKK
jgi:hypothetical protein